jgi:hypothetical protein
MNWDCGICTFTNSTDAANDVGVDVRCEVCGGKKAATSSGLARALAPTLNSVPGGVSPPLIRKQQDDEAPGSTQTMSTTSSPAVLLDEEDADAPEWGALIGICDTPLVSHQDSEVVFEFAVGTALAIAVADDRAVGTVRLVMHQNLNARNVPGLTTPTPSTNSQSEGGNGRVADGGACGDACGGGDTGGGTNGMVGTADAAGGAGAATSNTDETPTLSETTVTTGAVVWDGAVIVRCAFFDRNLHSKMPSVSTPAPLEALACV